MSQPFVYFVKFTFLLGKGCLRGGQELYRAYLDRKNKFLKFLISLTSFPTPPPKSRQRHNGNKEITGLIPAVHTPNSSLSLTSRVAPGNAMGLQTVQGKPKSQESHTVSNWKKPPRTI